MYQTLTTAQAADLLCADQYASWSYAGARALVEYIESIEDDTGEDIEFEECDIRCRWSEYASAFEAATEYGYVPDTDPDDDDGDKEAKALDWLQKNGSDVVSFSGGVVVQGF